MKLKSMVIATVAASMLSGCISLPRDHEQKLRALEGYGISPTAVERKSPGTAAALNILPGVGNFYLAYGTHESGQWTVGALNLLFWPLSIVWAIPQGAIDATSINKMETIYYYTNSNEGLAELEKRKALKEQGSNILR